MYGSDSDTDSEHEITRKFNFRVYSHSDSVYMFLERLSF